MKFRAVIQLNGKTATGIVVPPDVITSLGQGSTVRVTIAYYISRATCGSRCSSAVLLRLTRSSRFRHRTTR